MNVKKARSDLLLRERAESQLRQTRSSLLDMKSYEIQELVHELQVHQIELKMQNEALRQAQEALETSRQKYQELYDQAPVGYLTLDRQGAILEANLTAAGMLGCGRDKLIGTKLSMFISPWSQDAWYMHFRSAFHTGEPRVAEIELIGSARVLLNSAVVAGKGICRISMSDISSYRPAQA
jgi:PAS domain-containing protein